MKPARDRLSIGVAMLFIAGTAVGLWLAVDELRRGGNPNGPSQDWVQSGLFAFVFILGGLSLVGPPLLLVTARRRPWAAGKLLWFTQGTAAWLLWPPAIFHRATVVGNQNSISAVCFFYGTPPMALYVTLSLLAGGYFKRSRRIRMRRSWQEIFGLFLGLAWACTGLYIISLFYRQDIFGK